ncbi:SwmB domain-containing protein [Sulfuritalea sp.]|uniref:beta strand repeat-containing protein n=1 Tax=Sulfuritalea sp. TaxID=2480090 RepID=UPI00286D95EC|nr:SwmB domain-containing protein [Sulfuritalea sp.]
MADAADRDSDLDTTELIRQESGSNTWSWTDGTTTRTETSSFEWYYANDTTWTFLGGQEVRNGETTTYDASWNVISRTTTISTDFTELTNTADKAYILFDDGNAGTPLYYKQTNSWVDGANSSQEISYYDASGTKLGVVNVNVSTWFDSGQNKSITSTNKTYNEIDSNGNWKWVGSGWSDDNGNSGSNTRTVEAISFDFNGDGTVAVDETNQTVQVERGENTWSWVNASSQTQTETSSFEHYYANDSSWTHLGGKETRNGETTAYDANWNVISRTFDTTGLTDVLSNTDGMAYDLFGAALYRTDAVSGETTYFDAITSAKIGSSNTNTWNDGSYSSTNTTYNDANWNWLGSEFQDSYGSGRNARTVESVTFDFDGNVTTGDTTQMVRVESGQFTPTGETTPRDSWEYYYSNDGSLSFLGGWRTMNGVTTTFDSNWNIIGGGPTDPNDTTIPSVVGAIFTEGENSTITLRISEAVTWSGTGTPMLSFFKNPDYSNGWSQDAYNASVISITGYSVDATANTVSFSTNASLTSTDIVQVQYNAMPMHGSFVDGGGNSVQSGEIWFGGSGASIIDLDNHGSWLPIQIRGNGGDDRLVGTNAADVLIDGGGADTLIGGEGSDTIVLVENGGTVPYSRDVVIIAPGDSIVGARDLVKGSATSPTDTGFDIASSDALKHDVLSLPSALIAGNTTGIVDGTDSAGGISGHSISNGIATFHNVSGTSLVVVFNATDAVAGTSVTSSDAVAYLAANIHEVGATVGFKVDVNSDGSLTNSDSLVVFQDAGTLATQGGIAPPDTLVTLSGLIGVASATLGNTEGVNVVQLVDVQGPEVIGFGLTSDGFQLDFTENALMPTGTLALTMKKNGTDVVTFSSVDGGGTANWTVHTDTAFTQEDWVLINYNGSDSSNGFRDVLGNVRMDHDEVGYGGSAEGGSGNTVIDLSNSTLFSATGGYDLEGAPGNDTLIGSAGSDWLEGGTGADTMTGGAGDDDFGFNPGDGTAVSYASGVYTFAGGADMITDFALGDGLNLNLPATRDWAATSPDNMGDDDYILVQGNYSGGSFNENVTGTDTLLVYDGDATSNFAATGVVLSGVTPSQFSASGDFLSLFDYTAPVLLSAAVNGSTLTLTYGETLDANSVPLPGDFTVGTGAGSLTVSSVAVSGTTVALTLASAVAASDTVTVGYAGMTVQDSTGNDAATLSGYAVNNVTGGATTGATFINWTNNEAGPVTLAGDRIEIQVHFSNQVVVTGAPTLSLDIYSDAGTLTRTVQATFEQYSDGGFNPAFGQSSMKFVYTATAADIGTFHIGSVSLNGGSITGMADQLSANLTLDSTNRTITTGSYLYGDMVASGSGTAANDAIGVYENDPALVQVTDGQYVVSTGPVSGYSVTGGEGNRDILGVPIVLPGTMDAATANGYHLEYDVTSGQIRAIASDGSVAISHTVPTGTFALGVEQFSYHIMYFDGTAYQYTDATDILLANGVATYTDAAASNEHFVRGSLGADVIDLSSDVDAAARYTVRGGAGNDTITGSAGKDAILGDGGANVIAAGAGNDAIFVANNGNNTVADGGAGTDHLVFTLGGQQMAIAGRIMGPAIQSQVGTWGTTGFVANGTTNAYRLDTDDSGAIVVKDYTTLATLMTATNMETLQFRFDQWDGRASIPLLFGTSGADNLANVGTVSALLSGGAGSDTLAASNLGNDMLMGGSGNDSLNGGTARDLLYGGTGDDQINAGAGNYDWIVGGTGNDVLDGGAGTDYAGFVVHASGTTTPVIGAYDSSIGGFKVSQEGVDLAQIVWNAANSIWTVTDLSDLTATGFGTDFVSNVEYLTFDQDAGGIQALSVNMATLASQLGGGTPPADTTAPTLLSAVVNGATLTLTYDEALDGVSEPPAMAFMVNVNSSPAMVSDVAISGSTVTLVLQSAVTEGATVTVDYSVGPQMTTPIQDLAGNDAGVLMNQTVSNTTTGGTPPPSGDTTAPTVVGANFATNSITLTFSEALVTLDGSPQPQGLMLFQNPDPASGNQGTSIQVTGFTVSGNAYTFQTSTALGTNDVVQATYDAGWGNMGDAAGNELTSGEVWFGGNVANTIDLDNYGTWLPIQIRGNGGNDLLFGTNAMDVLIDGGGADTLMGREGSDTIVLVENGGLDGQPGYSRDVVYIQPGDSVVGAANRDIVVGSASSPSNTGFDIVSSDTTKHDQLSLPSALIAGNTAGLVDGTDSAGGIASHSIAGGIASFYNASGTLLSVVYNVADASAGVRVTSSDAVGYLATNFHEVGATVAFKVDLNNDGSLDNLDSLVIFQDVGTLVTQGGFAPLDTLITLSGQGGYGLRGLAAATLGTTEGANVVQLVDTQGPEVVGFGLNTGTGFQLDFTENAYMPTSLALTMKLSGTIDVVFTGLAGDGTSNWTVQTDRAFTQEDWVLINYSGSTISNGFRDVLGNVMVDTPDPGYGGSAEGGSGNNTIDLSAFTATGGYDLSGGAGNDILVGSAYEDWIDGGTGADTMTGGSGPDGFAFLQGDSPLVTLNNGVYSFASGAADVITDFGADDAIWIDMPEVSTQGPRSFGDSSYEVVQGSYGAGSFTAGAGADTLLVYDGDSTAGAAMSGVVLSGITATGLMTFGNYITLNTQPV